MGMRQSSPSRSHGILRGNPLLQICVGGKILVLWMAFWGANPILFLNPTQISNMPAELLLNAIKSSSFILAFLFLLFPKGRTQNIQEKFKNQSFYFFLENGPWFILQAASWIRDFFKKIKTGVPHPLTQRYPSPSLGGTGSKGRTFGVDFGVKEFLSLCAGKKNPKWPKSHLWRGILKAGSVGGSKASLNQGGP